MSSVIIRSATAEDAAAIGKLHAISWRSAYRGLLSDEYLDNDLEGERIRYWSDKMRSLSGKEFVLLAKEESAIVGFVAVMDKPEKGYDALIDNLHVLPHLKGKGIGGTLMKAAADMLRETGRKSVYLWVLNGNAPAAEFYKTKGGKAADESVDNFGGKMVAATRFVWSDLITLS